MAHLNDAGCTSLLTDCLSVCVPAAVQWLPEMGRTLRLLLLCCALLAWLPQAAGYLRVFSSGSGVTPPIKYVAALHGVAWVPYGAKGGGC
jgi:hypothetical protein